MIAEVLERMSLGGFQRAESLGQQQRRQPLIGSLPLQSAGRIGLWKGGFQGMFKPGKALQSPELVFGRIIDWIDFHVKTAGLD